jgi:hypothetical protein
MLGVARGYTSPSESASNWPLNSTEMSVAMQERQCSARLHLANPPNGRERAVQRRTTSILKTRLPFHLKVRIIQNILNVASLMTQVKQGTLRPLL